MTPEVSIVGEIVKQGGYAVLALVAIYALYKMGVAWAADNKAGREDIRNLQDKTLEFIAANTNKLAELGGKIETRNSLDDTRDWKTKPG